MAVLARAASNLAAQVLDPGAERRGARAQLHLVQVAFQRGPVMDSYPLIVAAAEQMAAVDPEPDVDRYVRVE